jgi:hypothetical protein
METKICSKCKEEKNICDFGNDRTRKNNLSYLCKKCLILKSKKYKENNKDKVTRSSKEYRKNNKERMKIARKEYIKKNKEKIKEYRRFYSDKKRKESTIVRISENIRRRILHILKSKKIHKKNKTLDILGCNFEYLKIYLENKFFEGMTWDNYGFDGWHIDHIIPLSTAQSEEEVYRLCHYTNLQPLWAKDNFAKGNKLGLFESVT